MDDVKLALEELKEESESGSAAAAAPPRRTPRWIVVAGLLALVLAVIVSWWLWRERTAREIFGPAHSAVAVLYFTNLTQDPALNWLDRGLAEMLTTNLAQVRGIDLLSAERISEVLQRMGGQEGRPDSGVALEVARRAGAGAFISGSLLRIGPSRLRLDVRAQSTSGQMLFSEKVEAQDIQGVFAMVDSLTARLAQRFLPADKVPEKGPLIEEVSTTNVEAYRRYQFGREYRLRMRHAEAVAEFEEAVRLDPQFALAYRELAGCYWELEEHRKEDEAGRKVDELQSRLPRKVLLAYQAEKADHAWDGPSARRAREALLAEYPRESDVRRALAGDLRASEPDRAVQLLRDGLALDPEDHSLWNDLSFAEAHAGHLDAALSATDRYRALLPDDPNPWDTRGEVLFQLGRHDEALAAYRKVLELKPDFDNYLTHIRLAAVYADRKDRARADAETGEYASRARGTFRLFIPVFDAQLRTVLGDLGGALEQYRQAVTRLAAAGQMVRASQALEIMSVTAQLMGQAGGALAFARRQDLSGHQYRAIAWLEGILGNDSAAQRAAAQFVETMARTAGVAALPPEELEGLRLQVQAMKAVERGDARTMLTAVNALALKYYVSFVRGRAHLLLKDYPAAQRWLESALTSERGYLENTGGLIYRSPLIAALCHFYLAQVHEGAGRPERATAEYREFLSRFERPPARLPEVGEARAALNRLAM